MTRRGELSRMLLLLAAAFLCSATLDLGEKPQALFYVSYHSIFLSFSVSDPKLPCVPKSC
jgi:hypothetical protein